MAISERPIPQHQATQPKQAKEPRQPNLAKEKYPIRLIVDDAVCDDNSVVTIHHNTMSKLDVSMGDTVMIKGDKGKNAICNILLNESCEEAKIQVNKAVRKRLGEQS